MSTDEPHPICEGCGVEIDPNAPDVVEAVELVPVPGFGAPDDVAEGLHVYFREACEIGAPRYKRV